MQKSVEEAMEYYYKLKDKYDNKVLKAKKDIIKNKSLDKTTKMEMLSNIQPGCVNCKHKGKMLFLQKDNQLIAKCQATKKDNTLGCNLDIIIDRGDFEQINNFSKYIEEEINEFRENIIKTKLDLLFGYVNEEQALALFTEQKNEYNVIDEQRTRLIIEINKIMGKDKKQPIAELQKNILIIIDNIRRSVSDNNLSEAVSIYVNDLMPLLKELRELKYVANKIMCNDGTEANKGCNNDTFHLIQDPFTYKELQIQFKEPKVIKLDK